VSLTPEDWHNRYVQQAGWTEEIRHYIIDKVWNPSTNKILEVGCGSGAILSTLPIQNHILRIGVDLDSKILGYGSRLALNSIFVQADGYHLPIPTESIDICFCHFLLLWIPSPVAVLQEMKRVTRTGGVIIAFAEPDYGGRIDHPPGFIKIGNAQIRHLIRQGADPMMGRRLPELFYEAGLVNINSGILGAQLATQPSEDNIKLEWDILLSDLDGELPEEDILHLRDEDEKAWAKRIRILFVPTFYAWGYVP